MEIAQVSWRATLHVASVKTKVEFSVFVLC
jgi:hypothetical protein